MKTAPNTARSTIFFSW